jgi:hypothetical protein
MRHGILSAPVKGESVEVVTEEVQKCEVSDNDYEIGSLLVIERITRSDSDNTLTLLLNVVFKELRNIAIAYQSISSSLGVSDIDNDCMLVILGYVDLEISEEHVQLIVQSLVKWKSLCYFGHTSFESFNETSLTLLLAIHCHQDAECRVCVTVHTDIVSVVESVIITFGKLNVIDKATNSLRHLVKVLLSWELIRIIGRN